MFEKKYNKSSTKSVHMILSEDNKHRNTILSLSTPKNNNQINHPSNKLSSMFENHQNDLINAENFISSHLCNRDVE